MPNNEQNQDDKERGFFGGLRKYGANAGYGSAGPGSDFKNEKQELNDYSEIFSNEKKMRAGNKPAPEETAAKYTVPESLKADEEEPVFTPSVSAQKEEAPIPAAKKESISKNLVSTAKKWTAPRILKTNLIKGEITTFIDWRQNIRKMVSHLTLAFFALGAVYFGLVFWEFKAVEQSQELGGEISDLKLKIDKIESEVRTIDVFQEKLKYVELLLDEHVYWNNVAAFLEKNLLPKVVITGGLSGDLSGEFSFSAQADSFNTVAEQIKLLRLNNNVLEVAADGGTLAQIEDASGKKKSVVDFKLEFKIDPALFNK